MEVGEGGHPPWRRPSPWDLPLPPTPQTRRGRSHCNARLPDTSACRMGGIQLAAWLAVVTGAATGVALTGVPFNAAHAATTAGCTSSISTVAAFVASEPKVVTTGWATGT